MQRNKVTSSQMVAVGFENGVMEVEFHPKKSAPDAPGAVYRYSGEKVQGHYEALMAEQAKVEAGTEGASVGSYFVNAVKKCPHTTFERVS